MCSFHRQLCLAIFYQSSERTWNLNLKNSISESRKLKFSLYSHSRCFENQRQVALEVLKRAITCPFHFLPPFLVIISFFAFLLFYLFLGFIFLFFTLTFSTVLFANLCSQLSCFSLHCSTYLLSKMTKPLL